MKKKTKPMEPPKERAAPRQSLRNQLWHTPSELDPKLFRVFEADLGDANSISMSALQGDTRPSLPRPTGRFGSKSEGHA